MQPLQHYGRHSLTHVEPRPGGHAYVRWFRYPYQRVQVLRRDGQPDCDWDWACSIEMTEGRTLLAFIAQGMPEMDEFRDVLTAATKLGARRLVFEHGGKTNIFNLSKYKPSPKQTNHQYETAN